MTAPPPSGSTATTVEAYAAAQAAAQQQVLDRTLALLFAAWALISDPRDPDQLRRFAGSAANTLRAAETAVGRLTEAYLRRVFRSLGVRTPNARLVVIPGSLRFGVPTRDVVLRPAATVRYLRSEDTPRDAADAAGRARLQAIGETQVQLAQREASRQVYERVEAVRGYRRVIRPELSEGGTCGLCVAASDRIYRRGDLMPIHDKCKCITLPIVGAHDPGFRLNELDLKRLYKGAGGTAGAKLKRTRYRVEQHGELGPVLVRQDRAFRTAADAGEALLGTGERERRDPAERRRSYAAQLATFEASIPALERRAAAGEDVAAALTWQRARAEELRRLLRGRAAA